MYGTLLGWNLSCWVEGKLEAEVMISWLRHAISRRTRADCAVSEIGVRRGMKWQGGVGGDWPPTRLRIGDNGALWYKPCIQIA